MCYVVSINKLFLTPGIIFLDPEFVTFLLCAVFQSYKQAVIHVSFGLRADVGSSELTDDSRQMMVLTKHTAKETLGHVGRCFCVSGHAVEESRCGVN